MRIEDIPANSELLPLWPEHDVFMRPMSVAQGRRIRDAGAQAKHYRRLAKDARAALDAELDAELDADEPDEARAAALERHAAECEAKAEAADATTSAVLFDELVCDAAGQPAEGDRGAVTATGILRIWQRVEEVHEELGKSQRRRSKRGSRRGAATPTG